MGSGANAEVPLQVHTDLEQEAGEEIKYDLLAELRMEPVEGDDILEGKEENQRFYTDSVYVDQARCGVNTGGRMTRKRTIHNLREKAKRQQSGWWARFDELVFIYLSGARGVNDNFITRLGYASSAGNTLVTGHEPLLLRWLGNGVQQHAAGDKMDLALIDKLVTRAETQGGGATDVPVLQPCMVDGEEHFVFVATSSRRTTCARPAAATRGWTSRRHWPRRSAARARSSRVAWHVPQRDPALAPQRDPLQQRGLWLQQMRPRAPCSWAHRLAWWLSARPAPACASTGTRKPATTTTWLSSPRRAFSA